MKTSQIGEIKKRCPDEGMSQQHPSIWLTWCKYKHWQGPPLQILHLSVCVCVFGSLTHTWPTLWLPAANTLSVYLLYSEISETQNIVNARRVPATPCVSPEFSSAIQKPKDSVIMGSEPTSFDASLLHKRRNSYQCQNEAQFKVCPTDEFACSLLCF